MGRNRRAPGGRSGAKRLLVAICAIVFLIGVGFLGAAFLPRWWAHRVGDQVNGEHRCGRRPGALLRLRLHRDPRSRSFALRSTSAAPGRPGDPVRDRDPSRRAQPAHPRGRARERQRLACGERTLDVEAPAYRSAALAGAILAVMAFALLQYLLVARNRSRREARAPPRRAEGEQSRRRSGAERPVSGRASHPGPERAVS